MSEERETPTPRPFKVGDRVRVVKGSELLLGAIGHVATIDAIQNDGRVSFFVGFTYYTVATENIEHATPAPAPEATAAPDGTLRAQYVPTKWLDDARKVSDEWEAKHADAKARLGELRQTIDELGAENKELTARAEKAEAEVHRHTAIELENAHLRECLAKFTDGGMIGAEVRASKADERARFERECAMRFRAAFLTHGDGDFSELEEARKLADHYFPKEQGK